MDINSCFKIGWILKPHGLKGEVTVILEEETPENWTEMQSVYIEQNYRLVPYFIQAVSAQERKAFIKFEDIDTTEAALKISKQSIYIEKSMRPKSGRGEFYVDEVIGFGVYEEEKGFLGNVLEVMQAGPNKLLVVQQNEKEVLIPINGPFITSVNKSKRRVSVSLPDGFLDI